MSDVVQKFWGFCHTLRHDGIDYGDYIEQITYLLFLKMADERGIDLSRMAAPPDGAAIDCSWPALADRQGEALTQHYNGVLRRLSQQQGLLGDIFTRAASRFNNPANLKHLIGLIDETRWTTLEIDLKAAVFEGLLEKAASEGKKGAGQYFTPRRLIQSIVQLACSPIRARVPNSRSATRRAARAASWCWPMNGCCMAAALPASCGGRCAAAPISARSWCSGRGASR